MTNNDQLSAEEALDILNCLGLHEKRVTVKGMECQECGHVDPDVEELMAIGDILEHCDFAYTDDVGTINVAWTDNGLRHDGCVTDFIVFHLGYSVE